MTIHFSAQGAFYVSYAETLRHRCQESVAYWSVIISLRTGSLAWNREERKSGKWNKLCTILERGLGGMMEPEDMLLMPPIQPPVIRLLLKPTSYSLLTRLHLLLVGYIKDLQHGFHQRVTN